MDSSKYFRKPWYNLCWIVQQTRGFLLVTLCHWATLKRFQVLMIFFPAKFNFLKEFFILLIDHIDITRKLLIFLLQCFWAWPIVNFEKLLPQVLTTKLPFLNSSYKDGSLTGRCFKSCMNTETHLELWTLSKEKNKGAINSREATRRWIFASLKDPIIKNTILIDLPFDS